MFIVNLFVLSYTLTADNLLTKSHLLNLAKTVVILMLSGQLIGLILGVDVKAYGGEGASAGLSDNISIIAAQALFVTPVLLLSEKRNKSINLFFLLVFASILLTLRRSSLLSFLLIFVAIFIFNFLSSKINIKQKIKLSGLAILSSFSVLFALLSTKAGKLFLSRLEELDPNQGGTASGRYDFQSMGFDHAISRDILPFLFGEGYGSSIAVNVQHGFIPIGMHSDLLDILIGLGVLGFMLFLLFFLKCIKLASKLSGRHGNFNAVIGFIFSLGGIAIFTGGFFGMETILAYMTLGYVYAHYRKSLINHQANPKLISNNFYKNNDR